MDRVAALTTEYLDQRVGHLESLLIERFERRLAEQSSGLRQEIATARVDLLKWSFLFWIGQVAAIAGMLAFVLRSLSH
jgi:hypothetical protein